MEDHISAPRISQSVNKEDKEEKQQVDALHQIFSRIKLKVVGRKMVNQTESRRFKSIAPHQYFLLNDLSIPINPQTVQECRQGIFKSQLLKQNAFDFVQDLSKDTYINQFSHWLNNLSFIKGLLKILSAIPTISPSSTFKVHIAFNLPIDYFITNSVIYETFPITLIIDMFINMNTAYYDKGVPVTNGWKIIINYIKYNSITDMFSVIPFIIYHYNYSADNQNDGLNYVRLTLLLFFLKINSFTVIFKKIEERSHLPNKITNIIQLLKLLFTIIIIAHIVSCIWIYTEAIERQRNIGPTWIDSLGIQEAPWFTKYINGYYFATVTMITVGYGDILAKTNEEKLLCCLTMMFCCGVFAYSVNEVGVIFNDFGRIESNIKKNMNIINGYMKSKKINKTLQYSIRDYLEYLWREQLDRDQETEEKIISQLSDQLKTELMIESNKIVLKSSPIFRQNFNQEIIKQSVPLIQEKTCSPFQVILSQKQQNTDCSIYFVEKGTFEIYREYKLHGNTNPQIEVIKILKKGDSFGELSFFTGKNDDFINIRSAEFSTLLIIKREDFINLLRTSPNDYEQFCFIKDMIDTTSNYQAVNYSCISCGSSKHTHVNCEILHFFAPMGKLIKQLNKPQERSQYERLKKKCNSLLYQDEVQITAEEWQEDDENIEICEYMKDNIGNFPETEYMFYNQEDKILSPQKQKLNIFDLSKLQSQYQKIKIENQHVNNTIKEEEEKDDESDPTPKNKKIIFTQPSDFKNIDNIPHDILQENQQPAQNSQQQQLQPDEENKIQSNNQQISNNNESEDKNSKEIDTLLQQKQIDIINKLKKPKKDMQKKAFNQLKSKHGGENRALSSQFTRSQSRRASNVRQSITGQTSLQKQLLEAPLNKNLTQQVTKQLDKIGQYQEFQTKEILNCFQGNQNIQKHQDESTLKDLDIYFEAQKNFNYYFPYNNANYQLHIANLEPRIKNFILSRQCIDNKIILQSSFKQRQVSSIDQTFEQQLIKLTKIIAQSKFKQQEREAKKSSLNPEKCVKSLDKVNKKGSRQSNAQSFMKTSQKFKRISEQQNQNMQSNNKIPSNKTIPEERKTTTTPKLNLPNHQQDQHSHISLLNQNQINLQLEQPISDSIRQISLDQNQINLQLEQPINDSIRQINLDQQFNIDMDFSEPNLEEQIQIPDLSYLDKNLIMIKQKIHQNQ